jgi:hypothetical protein
MKLRTRGCLIALAVIAIYAIICLLWWNNMDRPKHEFPAWTPAERQVIQRAWKEHGVFTVIRTMDGVYLERDGEVVWIMRGM